MISFETLRGYVLEELLAAELQQSGFSLLVNKSQDPLALTSRSNGLCVRGRGADHQVDVLGELDYEVPFSLPIRLFVEAKYRASAVGLSDVRNAVGVVNDVNEHYSAAVVRDAQPEHYKRFLYRYALFSASGFTGDAWRYAFAQQVSLINLDSPEYAGMLRTASSAASELIDLATRNALKSFPVGQMRESIRKALQSWPVLDQLAKESVAGEDFDAARGRAADIHDEPPVDSLPVDELAEISARLIEQRDGSLYFAVAQTPSMLLVNRRNAQLEKWDSSIEGEAPELGAGRTIRTARLISTRGPDGEDGWALMSSDGDIFRFNVSGPVEQEVLASPDPSRARRSTGRTLTILERAGEKVLNFSPLEEVSPRTRAEKYENLETLLKDDEDVETVEGTPTAWSLDGVMELLRILDAEGWPQAKVIRRAGLNGGTVLRSDVYAIAGYPPSRTLRGFTRPTRRITTHLVKIGKVERGVATPLTAVYDSGVLATRFRVPDEFVDFLRGDTAL